MTEFIWRGCLRGVGFDAQLGAVGAALGVQAGEERIRSVVTAAGFKRFRRAAQTPFNPVFEARARSRGLSAH